MYNNLLIYNIVQWLILTREKVFLNLYLKQIQAYRLMNEIFESFFIFGNFGMWKKSSSLLCYIILTASDRYSSHSLRAVARLANIAVTSAYIYRWPPRYRNALIFYRWD